MPCCLSLGSHRGGEPLAGELTDQPVLENARGVENSSERVLSGNACKQARQLLALGEIALGDRYPGRAKRQKLLLELLGTWRLDAATTGEQEVLGSLPSQPAGEMPGERAGASGYEHGPRACPRILCWAWLLGDTEQARSQHTTGADHRFVLARAPCKHATQAIERALVGLERQIDQAAPPIGALQAHHTPQAPHRSLRGLGEPVGGPHGHGAACG